MLEKIWNKLEEMEIDFRGLAIGFTAIVFVRIFLENFSSVPLSGLVTSDAPTIVHYYLFYLGTVVLFLILNQIFTGRFRLGENLVIWAALSMWLPPIFDLLVSGGRGYFMHYPTVESPASLASNFFAFLRGRGISAVTPGQYAQFILGLVGVCVYIYYATRKIIKTVAVAVLSYVIVFFWATIPSAVKIIYEFFTHSAFASLAQFYTASMFASLIPKNFLHPTIALQPIRAYEIFFGDSMSQIYYLLITAFLAVYIYLSRKRKLIALLNNARLSQFLLYYLMLGAGLFAAQALHPISVFNWLSVISLAVLCLSLFSGRMFAVGADDLADMCVDAVSHPERALVSGELSVAEMKSFNLFFFAWALVGAFIVGHYMFFLMSAAFALSHIYSSPPLRLKRFPFVASFLMALAVLSVALMGFYFLSFDQSLTAFPLRYALLIVTVGTLAFNMKDIKEGEAEGDRAGGIYTLPVLFGEKRGRQAIGAALAASFLVAPAVLGIALLWIPSLLGGAAAYIFANIAPYKEWKLAALYFLYIVAVAMAIQGVTLR